VLALAFLREEGRAGWKRAALLVMMGHAFYDIGLLGGAQALEAVSGSLGRA